MIKYFCDRCGHELAAYEYENHCTTISKDVAFDEQYKYKLCGFCTAQFSKFISGEEVKRVERVKENSEMNTIAEKYNRAKELLKAAVPIINNTFPETGSCWGCANHDEAKDECKCGAFEECSEVCKWEHTDEALRLIES